MEFECDLTKSAANKGKHGIDFVEAQALWSDPFLIEAPALTEDEPRAIFTWRGSQLRIISVRRARKTENERYESP